jgi:hypothetical protein
VNVASMGTPSRSDFPACLARASVFAGFVLLISLLGELIVDLALRAPFTGFWAFSLTASMLAFFPLAYQGLPLGYGLSGFSKNKTSISMTRSLRFSIFVLYLVVVIGLALLCSLILRQRQLHLGVDVWYVVFVYMLVSLTYSAFYWRKL